MHTALSFKNLAADSGSQGYGMAEQLIRKKGEETCLFLEALKNPGSANFFSSNFRPKSLFVFTSPQRLLFFRKWDTHGEREKRRPRKPSK